MKPLDSLTRYYGALGGRRDRGSDRDADKRPKHWKNNGNETPTEDDRHTLTREPMQHSTEDPTEDLMEGPLLLEIP